MTFRNGFLAVALQSVEAGLGKINRNLDDAARALGDAYADLFCLEPVQADRQVPAVMFEHGTVRRRGGVESNLLADKLTLGRISDHKSMGNQLNLLQRTAGLHRTCPDRRHDHYLQIRTAVERVAGDLRDVARVGGGAAG